MSKRVRLIPIREEFTAKKVAKLFFEHIMCQHGLPLSIVSDQDPKFTSEFWRELFKCCGTKLMMSSTYHLQTDRQSKRANRVIKEVLRTKINAYQDNWDKLLPKVEFVMNNSVSA